MEKYELEGVKNRFASDGDFRAIIIRKLLAHIDLVQNESKFHQGKCLVVLHHDGYCEAFADDWTDLRVVSVQPWEEAESRVAKLGERWAQMYIPTNCTEVATCHAMAPMANLTHEEAMQYADRVANNSFLEALIGAHEKLNRRAAPGNPPPRPPAPIQ